MVTSYSRGHETIYIKGEWLYKDTMKIDDDSRPCKRCKCYPTKQGHDPCIDHYLSLTPICCGHGVNKPISL